MRTRVETVAACIRFLEDATMAAASWEKTETAVPNSAKKHKQHTFHNSPLAVSVPT
jgi:hypothetical protein